jgi:hypothetical protein
MKKKILSLGALFLAISASVFAASGGNITSAEYIDADKNGTVDHIKLTFDQNITQCDYEAGD